MQQQQARAAALRSTKLMFNKTRQRKMQHGKHSTLLCHP
jgi:hypothetical protein